MAQPTLIVKDGNGSQQTIFTQNPNGNSASAAAQPVTIATDLPSAADTIFFNESVTPLAGSATYTGTTRDSGVAAGALADFSSFNAFVLADQSGIMRIELSNDNVTWRRATLDTAIVANTPLTLRVPLLTRYWRVIVTNGATLQTVLMINSGFLTV